MEEKKMMKIVAEDGSTEDVEVVFAFEFKDNKKEYVIYTYPISINNLLSRFYN